MTDKPHTPTTDRMRDLFSFAVAWDAEPTELHIIAMQDKARKGFDRWLDARDDKLITAAEQRGAVMVIDALKREASDSGWEGIVQPGRSLQELVDHMEHVIRADQEGDE